MTLPILIPMIGAPIVALAGRKKNNANSLMAILVTLITLGVTAALFVMTLNGEGEGEIAIPGVMGLGFSLSIKGLHGIFACIASYMWFMTTVYSHEYMVHSKNLPRYYMFLLLSYGATMGVFLANDLFTSFVFFEIMSLTSYLCVVHNEDQAAVRAGNVYLAVVIIGGMVALMGLFLLYDLTGTLAFDELGKVGRIILSKGGSEAIRLQIFAICILVGYGSKAGMFPLHIWLPMAHPVAPAPASALLSGIITKTGIFGLIALAMYIFPGYEWYGLTLVALGTVTMLHGGTIALFSTDIKRTLACSSISQLGMIILGIGMQVLLGDESSIAIRGSIGHMFNHSNLKLVLFMAAGIIAMDIHKLGLNEIRGYGRKKNLLKLVFFMGAVGIMGIPFFNGYISKTLLHEGIVEYIAALNEGEIAGVMGLGASATAVIFKVIEWLFLITGGLTVAYMTKLFTCVFIEKNQDPEVQAAFDEKKGYMSKITAAVLILSAVVLPVIGMMPHEILERVMDLGKSVLLGEGAGTTFIHEHMHEVHYFNFENLKGALISIAFGAVFFMLSRKFLMEQDASKEGVSEKSYADKWPVKLDLITLIYEPLFIKGIPAALGGIFSAIDGITDNLVDLIGKTVMKELPHERKHWIGAKGYIGIVEDMPADQRLSRRFTREMITATAAYSLLLFGLGTVFVVMYVMMTT